MSRRIFKIIFFALVISGVFGCAQDLAKMKDWDSQLDKSWGRSFEAAKYNQTLNPDAEKTVDPVEGLEGPVGEKVMEGLLKDGDPKKKTPAEFGVVTIKQ